MLGAFYNFTCVDFDIHCGYQDVPGGCQGVLIFSSVFCQVTTRKVAPRLFWVDAWEF